jgi:hypothetical protein
MLVGETAGGKYFLPLAADLSEHGILLESPVGFDRPKAHDSIVEFMLPGIDGLIWARCKTLRKLTHRFFEGRALRFVNISAADRQKIRYFIQRRCGLA